MYYAIFDHITDLDLITEFDLLFYLMRKISVEQRVRHANRERLLLRTPGPVPLLDLHFLLYIF